MLAPEVLLTVNIACADAGEADRLAGLLVERRLAACVQTWPISSTYRWQGKVERAGEVLLSAKTLGGALDGIEALLAAEHSYDLPEMIVLPIVQSGAAYEAWVRESVALPSSPTLRA